MARRRPRHPPDRVSWPTRTAPGRTRRSSPAWPQRRAGRWPRALAAASCRARSCRPRALVQVAQVASPLARLTVLSSGLAPAHRQTGRSPLRQTGLDTLTSPRGFLLGHPASKRDEHVLDLRGTVQPGLLYRDDRAAALAELANDPES